MLTGVLCALFVQTATADYFPLRPGYQWEYDVTFGEGLVQIKQVQTTKEPIIIGEASVTPMTVQIDGKEDNTTYYSVGTEFYYISAYRPDSLLPRPIPVLPIAPMKGQKWQFEGESYVLGTKSPAVTRNRIEGTERVEIMGKKFEAIKLVRECQAGTGPASLNTRSTEWYVAGIGLVKMRQQVMAKNGAETTFTLVRFQVPQR